MELKCTFKGWPRPRVVWYNPKNKQIINGSEGFYISEQLDREDTLTSLLRNADIREKHAGAYKCTGMNDWSSKKSGYIDMNYRCESFHFLFLTLIYTRMGKTTSFEAGFIMNIIPCFPCKQWKVSHLDQERQFILSDLDEIKYWVFHISKKTD